MQAKIDQANAKNKHMSDERRLLLLTIIGSLVVLWAYLESSIDAWVEVIHKTGGRKSIQEQLPASLDRELDYIKAAWRITRVSPPLKAKGSILLAEIHRLKTFRHNLVHGLASLNQPDALAFHLWKVKGNERSEIKTPYTIDQILANSSSIIKLNQDLESFVIDFAKASIDIVQRGR